MSIKNSVSFCAETRRIATFNVNTISEHFKTYFSVVTRNLMGKLPKLLNKYNGNSETYLILPKIYYGAFSLK